MKQKTPIARNPVATALLYQNKAAFRQRGHGVSKTLYNRKKVATETHGPV